MHPDVFLLFDKAPGTLPLYEELERRILERYPDVTIKVKATQVSFYNTHAFAWAWPPFRRIKGRPGTYMIVTFGLGCQLVHSRIVESVEPYPGRWTHHVLLQHKDDIDEQLMDWIHQSYHFSLSKRKQRRSRNGPAI